MENRTLVLARAEEIFIAIWCIVMPVTGTVLIPSVQGTIPAYMLGFASLFFIFSRLHRGELPLQVVRYAKTAFLVMNIWLVFFACSQLGEVFSHRHDFCQANMIDPNDAKVVFRTSLFTQSLYLMACVLIALYFRYFFKDSWMRFVLYGGYFLAGYGIYEWTYYLIFHQTGDFLVNRAFGEEQHTGSWSQGINFGGLSVIRIKSTLGEPTFFAGVVLPFLFLAMDQRKVVLTCMLLFTALFSTSTACYIGLSLCFFVKSVWTGRIKMTYLVLLLLVGIFLLGMASIFPDTFNQIFVDKLSGDNDSGKMRLEGAAAVRDLLESFTIPNWLFGVGFGYTYLSVFMGLLVNTGILGLLLFVFVLFRPILLLPVAPGSEGLKMGLLAVAILFSLSLSELFLPTTWMFLGLAYRRLEQVRQGQAPAPSPAPGMAKGSLVTATLRPPSHV